MFINKKTARNKCARILDKLDYNFVDFNIDSFANSVGVFFGRKIYFLDLESNRRDILGAWITDFSEPHEYIMTRKGSLPPAYHLHVQCHELGHLLLQHDTLATSLSEIRNNPLSIRQRLLDNEKSRTDQQEVEAETMAYLILTRASNFNLARTHRPASTISGSELFSSMGLD